MVGWCMAGGTHGRVIHMVHMVGWYSLGHKFASWLRQKKLVTVYEPSLPDVRYYPGLYLVEIECIIGNYVRCYVNSNSR